MASADERARRRKEDEQATDVEAHRYVAAEPEDEEAARARKRKEAEEPDAEEAARRRK